MVTKKMIKATDKRIKTLQAAEAAEQHAKAEEEANMQVSHVRKEDWLVVFKILSLFFFSFFPRSAKLGNILLICSLATTRV